MKYHCVIIIPIAIFLLSRPAIAQVSSEQWQPSVAPFFNLHDIAVAKIYKNQNDIDTLGLILFTRITEKFAVEIPVEVTKTRQVTDPETGGTREEDYITAETRIETLPVSKFSKTSKRIEVPLENARIWQVDGKPLSVPESRSALATPKRCFYVSPIFPPDRDYIGDQFFAQMIKDDVLVIWYDQSKAKVINTTPP